MKLIKKIICYALIIISSPFLLVSITDYAKTKDSVNIEIFIIFFVPFFLSVTFLIKNRKKKNNSLTKIITTDHSPSATSEQLTIAQKSELPYFSSTKGNNLTDEYESLTQQVNELKEKIIIFEDALIFQDFGLYTPRYNFINSDEYKLRLETIRTEQKEMIKTDTAILGAKNWTVDGSKSKGAKMVNDMKKLFLRAFNSDCDDVINRVKYNNYEMSLKKIRSSAESIEKLGKTMGLMISSNYINSKIEELHLAFEYNLKKQEEKEKQKEMRAEMREQAKLQKEIEEQRKRLEKEQSHYESAYRKLQLQLQEKPDDVDLLSKKDELEKHLQNVQKSLSDVDYREANHKAGYVYIISNVGSFGENVYKIGMTRRLEPQDRIDELGDASVPFNFDVHAMIFSDDAPALENALHKAFEDKKVNMVNHRREFFKVTLDEIKEVVKNNFDKTVEFIDFADAEQYRVSLKMRNE